MLLLFVVFFERAREEKKKQGHRNPVEVFFFSLSMLDGVEGDDKKKKKHKAQTLVLPFRRLFACGDLEGHATV